MQYFRVVQKVLSFGPTYIVYAEGSETPIMTVRGKLFSITPKLDAKEGEKNEGKTLATVTGNFFKTKFDMKNADGTDIGSIKFSLLSAIFKNFTLSVGGKSYKSVRELFAEKYSCKDESGKEMFVIAKEKGFRDKFLVLVDDSIQKELGILSAIVIDQKFFENKKK